jgi:hypothetical protein
MPVTLRRTTDFLPLIMPYCATCPEFLAEQMVRLAAIDFAERSRAWRHVITAQVQAGTPEVVLSGSVGSQMFNMLFMWGGPAEPVANLSSTAALATIHEFEFAEFDGAKLEPMQFSTMDRVEEGNPRFVTQIRPGVVAIWPIGRTGTLRMSLFLKPSAQSQYGTDLTRPLFDRYNVVPDFFLSIHGATIAAGALERILSIPDEVWTDHKAAAKFGLTYREKVDASFRANMRGQQRAPIRTKASFF